MSSLQDVSNVTFQINSCMSGVRLWDSFITLSLDTGYIYNYILWYWLWINCGWKWYWNISGVKNDTYSSGLVFLLEVLKKLSFSPIICSYEWWSSNWQQWTGSLMTLRSIFVTWNTNVRRKILIYRSYKHMLMNRLDNYSTGNWFQFNKINFGLYW